MKIFISIFTSLVISVCAKSQTLNETEWMENVLTQLQANQNHFENMTEALLNALQNSSALEAAIQSRIQSGSLCRTPVSQRGSPTTNPPVNGGRTGNDTDTGSAVAFYVRLSHDINSPRMFHVVDFTDNVTNTGDAFNGRGTGIFTCIKKGVYFFSWTIAVDGGKEIGTQIVKNNHVVGELMTVKSSGDFGTGTGSVVLSLEADDDVWIRVSYDHHLIHPTIKANLSYFTGFLIR